MNEIQTPIFAIAAENSDTGEETIVMRGRNLNQLAMRLVKDAEFLRERGFEGFTLQDNSMTLDRHEFTDTLAEHLRTLRALGTITTDTWNTLKGNVS